MIRNAIFLTFDDRYFEYAFTCINSIVLNYPNYPEILVFYDGCKDEVISFLNSIKNLKIMIYDFDFMNTSDLPIEPVNSDKVYFRYILWTNFFDDFDTILHLDADTIILQPLDELFFKTDFFAVKDFTPNNYSVFKKSSYNCSLLRSILLEEGIGLAPEKCIMLNAGVFILPKKYRGKEQFDMLLALTIKFKDYVMFADQSMISLWSYINGNEFSELIEYNFQPAFFWSNKIHSTFENFEIIAANIFIYHLTWWKPQSKKYQSFLKSSRKYLELDLTMKKLARYDQN